MWTVDLAKGFKYNVAIMAMYYGWIPPRSRKQPKRTQAFRPMKANPAVQHNPRLDEYREQMSHCPSVGDGIGNATVSRKAQYDDPELAAREEKARQVKHTVAPICNKGGYQVITAEQDLKTMGRKV